MSFSNKSFKLQKPEEFLSLLKRRAISVGQQRMCVRSSLQLSKMGFKFLPVFPTGFLKVYIRMNTCLIFPFKWQQYVLLFPFVGKSYKKKIILEPFTPLSKARLQWYRSQLLSEYTQVFGELARCDVTVNLIDVSLIVMNWWQVDSDFASLKACLCDWPILFMCGTFRECR